MSIKLDYSNCLPFLDEVRIETITEEADGHLKSLVEKKGRGNDYLGWLDLPATVEPQLARIIRVAEKLRNLAKLTVVIGIGGSYLGARAVISACKNQELLSREHHRVIFAGYNISEDYLNDLVSYIGNRIFNIIVISKSGTTTEPAISFRILKSLLEKNAGEEEASSHIVAVTDAEKGALRELANKAGYESFDIPGDVGGRFSVLTPVGLLPVACAGLNINKLIGGAKDMKRLIISEKGAGNPVLVYSSMRNHLYKKGFSVEMLINFEPSLHWFGEWWKQLFGESEGKESKGLFPASADMTSDLHSLGQFIQDGSPILFETVISVIKPTGEIIIPLDINDTDGLNYIAGKRLSEVNHKAEEGTISAHSDGGVPVIRIEVSEINEEATGQLIYFFEMACAVSGYTLGVNPFDQPGVEAYKRNMFRLLKKPGF